MVVDPDWVKGGPNAWVTPAESVGGMLKVIGGLGDGDNGKFFYYDGRNKPW